MTARTALPPGLGTTFTTREALDAGVPRGRLRASDIRKAADQLWSTTLHPTLRERAVELFGLLPPGGAWCHETAAHLHGLWLPLEPAADAPLHALSTEPRTRVRRPEIIWHRGGTSHEVEVRGGLALTTPRDPWVTLAADLDESDLIVLGDSIFRWQVDTRPWDERRLWGQPRVDPVACLGSALDPRLPGHDRAVSALAKVRAGAASRPESLLRQVVVGAGMPEPDLNADVWGRNGRWLGTYDLVWEDRRLIGEYDGDQHRTDKVQWQRDEVRLQEARADGWTVLVVRSHRLFRAPRLVAQDFLRAYHR